MKRRRKVKIPEKRMKEILKEERENLKRKTKRVSLRERGITLIALVVTIIILLILAGVTLNIALSNNGLFERAKGGTEKYKKAQTNEEELVADLETEMSKYGGENPPPPEVTPMPIADAKEKGKFEDTTKVVDKYGNIVVIPGGFKFVGEAEDTVQDGILIEDSDGNQFVWIPVSNVDGDNNVATTPNNGNLITKNDGTKVEITLGRYSFKREKNYDTGYTDGTPELKQNGDNQEKDIPIEDKYNESVNTERTNGGEGAKNLQDFINSVKDYNGYYIARYEAGKGTDEETPVSKAGQVVWNNITQEAASTAARGMYKENVDAEANYVESDLVNSYAWDTAIVYIQEMGNPNYANQSDGNGSLQNTGNRNDEKCHIHDMAGNVREWTTEYSTDTSTYDSSKFPCVCLGGSYYDTGKYTAGRFTYATINSVSSVGFRPLLYLK